MSEIHAAIGIEQINKLPGFLSKRKENFEMLENLLSREIKIKVLPAPVNDYFISCHYCLSVILNEETTFKRAVIMDALTALGIGSSVYYPQPVPRMKYYKDKYGYDASKYVNAAKLSDQSIALPVGPHLGEQEMKYIASSLINILNK